MWTSGKRGATRFDYPALHSHCFPEYMWHQSCTLWEEYSNSWFRFFSRTPPSGSKNTAPLRGTPQSRTTYIFNIKVPDGPVFQRYVRNWCHIDVFKACGAVIPVLLTFDLKQARGVTDKLFCSQSGCCLCVAAHSSLLVAACQHDQSLHVLLPDHSPEIFERGGQRTLSCNELFLGVVTLPCKTTQTSFFPGESHTVTWKTALKLSEWAWWKATEQASVIIFTDDEGMTEHESSSEERQYAPACS